MARDMKVLLTIGLRDLVSKGLDGIRKKLSTFEGKATMIGGGLAAGGTAIVASFGAAAKAAASYGDEIAEMSQRTGLSTDALQSLKYICGQTGASMGNVEMAVKTLSTQGMQALQSDTSQSAQMFKRLGVSVRDSAGNIKGTTQLFFETGDAIRNLSNDSERMAYASTLMGRGGKMLIPAFTDAKLSISQFAAEAKKLGFVLSAEMIEKLGNSGDTMDRLKGQLQMAVVVLGVAVMPLVQQFVSLASRAMMQVSQWADKHPTLTKALLTTVFVLGLFGQVFGPVLMALPGMIALWDKFGITMRLTALSALRARVATLAAGVAARASGIAAAIGAVGWGALLAVILAAAVALILVVRACNMGAKAWKAYHEAADAKKRGEAQEKTYKREGIVTMPEVAKDLGLRKGWERGTLSDKDAARLNAEFQKRAREAGAVRREAGTAGGIRGDWYGSVPTRAKGDTEADGLKAQIDTMNRQFSEQSQAQAAAPTVRVAAGYGYGGRAAGTVNQTNNITVNGAGGDPEQIARAVDQRLRGASNDLRFGYPVGAGV